MTTDELFYAIESCGMSAGEFVQLLVNKGIIEYYQLLECLREYIEDGKEELKDLFNEDY